jgi:uncharacterized membrane-anchored protein
MIMRGLAIVGILGVFLALSGPSPAAEPAAGAGAPAADGAEAKVDRYGSILRQGTAGPAHIALRDVATLDLPKDYDFIPEKPAADVMRKLGNQVDENFIGLIFPAEPSGWFMEVDYLASGHVDDDDAKNWKPDDLLKSIKENTETANKEREKEGEPGLTVVGWAEPPRYDAETRRLVWSVEARGADAKPDDPDIINYRTLMLGREGYVSMVMVTDLSAIEARKPIAKMLLSDVSFVNGKRYRDFNASTDRVAEYGLAALVAGVAVKKLGLIAMIVAFALKFAKVIAIAAFGLLAGFRRWFRRPKPASGVASAPAAPLVSGTPDAPS